MNIIERGRQFCQRVRGLSEQTEWEQRRCPHCGESGSSRWGSYQRQPWTLTGRPTVSVQRYRCGTCRRTYTAESAELVRRGWYARDVRRCAVDAWLHQGTSLRRAAELVRSWVGRQERWRLWRPLDPAPPAAAACRLSASTVERWLDGAGRQAQATLPGHLTGVASSGQVLTDGLWARLRGGRKRVVLLLTDSVSGVIWPPVVAAAETTTTSWAALFDRAATAGLAVGELLSVASDGATGLATYLSETLTWVTHQRCIFHLWRGLAGEFAACAADAAAGLTGTAARSAKRAARRELAALVRAVLDAADEEAAWGALGMLGEHPHGAACADTLRPHLAAALVYRRPDNAGLVRASPEWCWRDFRLRLGHGRNHFSDQRLERAALVWAIYRNFTPAQDRSERKRTYRHPGRCPLAVAGSPPAGVSYLDALAI
jgi:transposase-like protein